MQYFYFYDNVDNLNVSYIKSVWSIFIVVGESRKSSHDEINSIPVIGANIKQPSVTV